MTSKLLMSITDDSKIIDERYRVYKSGLILSLYWAGGLRVKPLKVDGTFRDDGENYLTLRREDGEPYLIARARLIAKNFVPNPNGYIHIKFLDGNKRNCDASNLKWVRKIDRSEDKLVEIAKTRWKKIYTVTRNGEVEFICTSISSIVAKYKVGLQTLYECIERNEPIRGALYISRYEKGSAEADELWKLLHADTQERHVN